MRSYIYIYMERERGQDWLVTASSSEGGGGGGGGGCTTRKEKNKKPNWWEKKLISAPIKIKKIKKEKRKIKIKQTNKPNDKW